MPDPDPAAPGADDLDLLRDDLHTLATAQGWAEVAALTTPAPGPVLLAGGAGLDLASLRRWLTAAGGAQPVPVEVSEAHQVTATAARPARRVVLAVDAGAALPPEVGDLVRRVPDTEVVVLVGPDSTPGDVARTATQLAVVHAAAVGSLPDPTGHPVLVWTDGRPAPALADRIGRDMTTLAARVADPGDAAVRLEHAVDLAADLATDPDGSRIGGSGSGGAFERAVAAVDAVRALRREVLDAIDHEVGRLRGTGVGSLAVLRRQAEHETERFASGGADPGAAVPQLLQGWRQADGRDVDERLARVRDRAVAALDRLDPPDATLVGAVRTAAPRWPAPTVPAPALGPTPTRGSGTPSVKRHLLPVAGAVAGAAVVPLPLMVPGMVMGLGAGIAADRLLGRRAEQEHGEAAARLRRTAAARADDSVRAFGTDVVAALTATRDTVAAAFDTALARRTADLHTVGALGPTDPADAAAAVGALAGRLRALRDVRS